MFDAKIAYTRVNAFSDIVSFVGRIMKRKKKLQSSLTSSVRSWFIR
jgi:hypothetical protein